MSGIDKYLEIKFSREKMNPKLGVKLTRLRAILLIQIADYLMENYPLLLDTKEDDYLFDDIQATVTWIYQQIYKKFSPYDLNSL